MKGINIIKVIIGYVIISLLLAFGITSTNAYILIGNEGKLDTVRMDKDITVSQDIDIEKTNRVGVRVYNGNPNSNGIFTVIVTYGDNREKLTVNYNISDIETYDWNYVWINTKNIKKITNITCKASQITENDDLSLIIREDNKSNNLLTFAKVNGKNIANRYLKLSYQWFSVSYYFKCLLFSFIIIFLISTVVYCFYRYVPEKGIVFLGLIIPFITMLNNEIFDFSKNLSFWCTTPWLYSYRYGFISRGLPGTLLEILHKVIGKANYFSSVELRKLYLLILFFLLGLIIYILSSSLSEIKKIEEKYYEATKNIIILFIMMPFYVTFYCQVGKLGRLDLLLTICFLLACICICLEKFLFLIPVFCCAAILTHQIFIFTELPIIIALMIYKFLAERKNKFAITTFLTLISGAILGFYCQFYGKIKGYDYKLVFDEMQSRTNTSLLQLALNSEHYFSTEHFKNYYLDDFIGFNCLFKLILTFLCVLPILYIYYRIFKSALYKAKSKSICKLCMLLILMCPLAFIIITMTPAFDWGRWFAEWLTALIVGILVMERTGNKAVLEAVYDFNETISSKFGKSWPLYLGTFYLLLGKVDDGGSTQFMMTIIEFTKKFMSSWR